MLRRTIHAAKYISDLVYRRKMAGQLNKGESLHSLRSDLHYAHRGNHPETAPDRANRTGMVLDGVDQRRRDLVDGVLPPWPWRNCARKAGTCPTRS
jgi:hypothetical protein